MKKDQTGLRKCRGFEKKKTGIDNYWLVGNVVWWEECSRQMTTS